MDTFSEYSQNGHIDKKTFSKIYKHIRLSVTKKYDFPPEVIKVQGVTIATMGNFSASTGKPKSKKTFNVSAIVASALCNHQVLQYKASFPPNKNKVLYVDTEQSECHCHKVLLRILKLAGLPTDKECDNIDFLVLRGYSPEQRRDIIGLALEADQNVGLVIIDGVRDLLKDINSPSESSDIINDLMRWSSVYGLHIHTVLHLNKQDDNTRGHLGTELNNKAETILQITKSRENSSVSEVRATNTRDKEFIPFAFEIKEDALPHLVGDYKPMTKPGERITPLASLTNEQHLEALQAVYSSDKPQTYAKTLDKLREAYESIGFKRGRNALVSQCRYLQEIGAIVKTKSGYRFNSGFTAQDEE